MRDKLRAPAEGNLPVAAHVLLRSCVLLAILFSIGKFI